MSRSISARIDDDLYEAFQKKLARINEFSERRGKTKLTQSDLFIALLDAGVKGRRTYVLVTFHAMDNLANRRNERYQESIRKQLNEMLAELKALREMKRGQPKRFASWTKRQLAKTCITLEALRRLNRATPINTQAVEDLMKKHVRPGQGLETLEESR